MQRKKRLGELLLNARVITEDQLKQALQEQKQTGKKLGEILLEKGWLTEKKLIDALSQQLGIPKVSLLKYTPDPEVLQLVPEHVARRHGIVPLAKLSDTEILVATYDPLNVVGIDEIRMITGMDVKVGVATPSEVEKAIDTFYGLTKAQETLKDMEAETEESPTITIVGTIATEDAEDAPIIRLLNTILDKAVTDGASDVHIEPHEKTCRIRYRIDGALFDMMEVPIKVHPPLVSRIKIIGNMNIAEKRLPQDGRVIAKIKNKTVDIRISTLPTIFGEKTVLRILDRESPFIGLHKLGLDPQDLATIEDILKNPHGIIFVTGPTGSGKTTTLYSMLQVISRPDVNIITVEDPVEYILEGCNQVQVNEKAGLTFAETLRSILRQDPDKIMVGEIRDKETAELAIRAALTGHLVLSTLHTNDAPSAIVRLIDMGIQPFLVSTSIVAVISQRLVRRLCDACKQPYQLPDNIAKNLGLPLGSVVYKAVGCEECNNIGYKGRTGIFEIMIVDDEIRDLINKKASSHIIKEAAIKHGMRTLKEAGVKKVLDGTTSLEEMLHVTMQ